MPEELNIAIIGDLFVRAAHFEDALRQCISPIMDNLNFVSMEVPWPDEEIRKVDEVYEALGNPAAIIKLAHDAHILATHVAPITQAVIDACPQLRIIGCCRGGLVNVNVKAASARRIPVVNAPGRNTQAVIEFTLGLILAVCRGIGRSHKALGQGVWQGELYRYDMAGRELHGQTIGLVGFGAIAQGLVAHLHPFAMRILAYDPYVPAQHFIGLGVQQVDLATLLAESDIVSIHARVTPKTVGMIGAAELAQMKRGAYLINTARGPLVDYDALYAALCNGRLAGAGLDTFPQEPPPVDWPLLRLPNVTATPHIAGASRRAAESGVENVAQDIANYLAGRSLARCVNHREIV